MGKVRGEAKLPVCWCVCVWVCICFSPEATRSARKPRYSIRSGRTPMTTFPWYQQQECGPTSQIIPRGRLSSASRPGPKKQQEKTQRGLSPRSFRAAEARAQHRRPRRRRLRGSAEAAGLQQAPLAGQEAVRFAGVVLDASTRRSGGWIFFLKKQDRYITIKRKVWFDFSPSLA